MDSDALWFCSLCMYAHCNGEDYPCISDAEAAAVRAGFERLADLGHVALASNEPSASGNRFNRRPCDCCGGTLADYKYEFALFRKGDL